MLRTPLVNLDITMGREHIMAQIALHHASIEKHINAEIERQLKHLSIAPIVQEHITKCIEDEVKSYFSWGRGRDIICGAIKEGLDKIFVKDEVVVHPCDR